MYGTLEVGRCTLDMNKCEKFLVFNARGICKQIATNTWFQSMLKKYDLPLACPMMPGNVTVRNYEVKGDLLAFTPLDGYIYNIVLKLITTDPKTKRKIVATCVQLEGKVEKIRV